MAIRRGPLNPPSSSTEVFSIAQRDTSKPHYNSTAYHVDMAFKIYQLSGYGDSWKKYIQSRLTGERHLQTQSGGTEGNTSENTWDHQNGWSEDSGSNDYYSHMWKRAPSYFDVVAYIGTGSATTIAHNLDAAPEMMWIKGRDVNDNWVVYHKDFASNKFAQLNSTGSAGVNANMLTTTAPTDSVFSIGTDGGTNNSGSLYIAYLFATTDGVSKVGSFSHDNSSTTNVDCGFSNGCRWLLIKRSDGSGDWRVYGVGTGILSGNDDYIQLNNTDALTSGDFVDPLSSGFTVTTNYDTGTYIFYAIA